MVRTTKKVDEIRLIKKLIFGMSTSNIRSTKTFNKIVDIIDRTKFRQSFIGYG